MKKAYICSPYRGDTRKNIENARSYCRIAVGLGYIPVAPHIYFTQFLDDSDEGQREAGINIALELLSECDEIWVFGKPTEGMELEIKFAEAKGIRILNHGV